MARGDSPGRADRSDSRRGIQAGGIQAGGIQAGGILEGMDTGTGILGWHSREEGVVQAVGEGVA